MIVYLQGRAATRFDVVTTRTHVDAVARWKAKTWAPPGAKSFTVVFLSRDARGDATARVTYYSAPDEGETALSDVPSEYPL